MVGTSDIPDWCFFEVYGSEGKSAYTESPSAEHLALFHVKTPTLLLLGAQDIASNLLILGILSSEIEDRLKAVLMEVTDSDGYIVLFMDEIHTLVGAEHVFLMDPIAHRNRDDAWKYIVTTAMNIFNAGIGKKPKKHHTWEVIKGPIQPDSKQCGFFVMRFMKEIIDGNIKKDQTPVSLKSMFQKRDFSKDDIDVAREEWATEVIEYL